MYAHVDDPNNYVLQIIFQCHKQSRAKSISAFLASRSKYNVLGAPVGSNADCWSTAHLMLLSLAQTRRTHSKVGNHFRERESESERSEDRRW